MVALCVAALAGIPVAVVVLVVGGLQFRGIATAAANLGLPHLLPWKHANVHVRT